MRKRHRKFTLIELLIVVAIIGILAALLLPSLVRAREAAWTAQCLTNFRTLNQFLYHYAADNNGYAPTPPVESSAWFGDVYFVKYLNYLTPYFPAITNGTKCYRNVIADFKKSGWEAWSSARYEAGNVYGNPSSYAAVPPFLACPAIAATGGNITGSNPFGLWAHRKGFYVCAVGAGKKGTSYYWYTNADKYPRYVSTGNLLEKLPSPSTFAYIFEPGWEPMQNDAFDKHSSTPYIYNYSSPSITMDGYKRFGHMDGYTVGFLDGHAAHKRHKRTHYPAKAPFSGVNTSVLVQGNFTNRWVDDRDI